MLELCSSAYHPLTHFDVYNVQSIGVEQSNQKDVQKRRRFSPSRNEIIEQIQFVIAMSAARSMRAITIE